MGPNLQFSNINGFSEKVEKVSVIVAPAAKKKRAATKAWAKAQKVTVIQPLALAIKKQETNGESSNEKIRRSKRQDNQIQRAPRSRLYRNRF